MGEAFSLHKWPTHNRQNFLLNLSFWFILTCFTSIYIGLQSLYIHRSLFFSLSTRNIAHRFSILRIQVNCLLFMTRQYSMKIYHHAHACIKLTVSLFVRKLGRKASNLKKKSTKLATFDFSFGKNYLTNRQRLQHTPHLYQIAPEGSFILVGGNEGRQKPEKIKLTIPYEIFCRQIIQTN